MKMLLENRAASLSLSHAPNKFSSHLAITSPPYEKCLFSITLKITLP